MAKETMLTYLDRQLTKKSLSTMLPLIGMQETIPSNLFYAYLQRTRIICR